MSRVLVVCAVLTLAGCGLATTNPETGTSPLQDGVIAASQAALKDSSPVGIVAALAAGALALIGGVVAKRVYDKRAGKS